MSEPDFHPPRAYRDPDFINAPDGRPVRILSEYLEPQARFEEYNVQDTILFFGSARIPARDDAQSSLERARKAGEGIERAERMVDLSRYYEDTRELARRLTHWSKNLKSTGARFVVCSGGGPGIMEAANRGASEAKGDNAGLGISLPYEQSNNDYVTRRLSFEFHYFFMRKFWFLYLAKAMVAMPGGFGTLDELFETLTLVQTGKIKKHMPIVLYGTDFWDKVIDMEALSDFGTISPDDLDLVYRCDTVDDAFDYLTTELSGFAMDHPGLAL